MAGVKGRSGGARPNSGPKPKPAPKIPAVEGQDPLEFLLSVQNNPEAPLKDRIRAAVAAAQYVHTKRGDGGKKDAKMEKARSAGKFEPAPPPKLAAVGGKKV